MEFNKISVNMTSNGMMFIEYYKKNEKDEIMKTSDLMVKITKKELEAGLQEDKELGIEHKIEYVNKKPERFQLGTLYILQTPKGRPDYIYTYQIEGS